MKSSKSANSSEKVTLVVEDRKVFGKKLSKVRKSGLVPGNVYGPDFKSQSISTQYKDFVKVFKKTGETGVVYLNLGKENIPVLIKSIQKHPVTGLLLHVDFRKIDLTKKVETDVPVMTIGVSEAVTQKAGVMLVLSETLLVEALPEDIPPHIEVDISTIKEIGQEIKVANLKKSDKYVIKTPVEKVVVSVIAHKEESITPETAAAAPEIITEAAAEGAEGAENAEKAGTGAVAEGGKKEKTDKTKEAAPAKKEAAPAPKK